MGDLDDIVQWRRHAIGLEKDKVSELLIQLKALHDGALDADASAALRARLAAEGEDDAGSFTLLDLAIRFGHVELIKALISNGICRRRRGYDVNDFRNNGRDALALMLDKMAEEWCFYWPRP